MLDQSTTTTTPTAAPSAASPTPSAVGPGRAPSGGGGRRRFRGMGFEEGSAALEPGAAGIGGIGGSGLLDGLVADFGSRLGEDFGDTEVVLGSGLPASRGAEGTMAGGVVHLAAGEASLGDPHVRTVLAHELVHVAQARKPASATEGEEGAGMNEAEADRIAAILARGGTASVETSADEDEILDKKKKGGGGLAAWQITGAIAYNKARGYSPSTWAKIQAKVGAGVDGIVGPDTVKHVAKWQAAHGLAADGRVGPKTMAALDVAGKKGAEPQAEESKKKKGKKKVLLTWAEVKSAIAFNDGQGFSKKQRIKIQKKVGTTPDGDIGPKTVQAIAIFQKQHGLEADGKVGPKTAKLIGVKPGGAGISPGSSNSQKLAYAKKYAVQIGLVITATTNGKHAPGSYHYLGRAIDVAGSHKKMSQFYWQMKKLKPTELFYDPIGGVKYGQDIGAIGGHSDHVHVAF